MALDFIAILFGTAFVGFSVLYFLLRKPQRPKRIQEKVDPLTGQKRTRIFEGAFERGIHDDLYLFSQALLTNVFFIESLVPLERSVLLEALVSLANVHPLLRMKCEWETSHETGKTQRYLTEMKQLGADELLFSEVNSQGSDWLARFEEELLQGYDVGRGPMWRVVRFKETFDTSNSKYTNTLLFSFHHAISDEISVLNFIDQLLEIMDQIHCNNFSQENLQPLPLLPPLLDLIDHHINLPWWKILLLKVQSVEGGESKFLEMFPPPLLRNPTMKAKTCIIPGSLTEAQTALLLKNCRTHKCTVTGALGACFAYSVGEMIAEFDVSLAQFCIGLPVNTRNGCKPVVNTEHFGLYIGIVFVSFTQPIKPMSLKHHFWLQAKELSNNVREQIHSNKQFGICSLLKYGCVAAVGNIEESKKIMKNAGRYPNFELSNCGYYDLGKGRAFKVTGAHFAVSQEIVGPWLTVSAVTVNGRLHWSVVYADAAVHKKHATKFSELFLEAIVGIGCLKL